MGQQLGLQGDRDVATSRRTAQPADHPDRLYGRVCSRNRGLQRPQWCTWRRGSACGQLVYATRCVGCHGEALQGEPGWPQPRPDGTLPSPPLSGGSAITHQSDQAIFLVIQRGGHASMGSDQTSGMPAFAGGLTDADIWATIAYIKSTWPSQR